MFDLLQKIYSLKQSEHYSPLKIAQLQERRLQKLLKHVLNHSTFYRNRYLSHSVSIKNISPTSLSDFPVVDKKTLMEAFDEVISMPGVRRVDLEIFVMNPKNRGKKYRETFQVFHTSGTTGTPGIFVYDPEGWSWTKAQLMSRVSRTKINLLRRTKLALIVAADGNYAGVQVASDVPRLLFNVLILHINSPLKDIVSALNSFQPDTISGYASGIHLLAQEQLQGTLTIHPKRVMCSADPLTPGMATRIKEAFATTPVNFYSASEALAMGVTCEKEQGLHLFTDWHVFEVVDRNGNKVPNGSPGRLLLTNLFNYAQPLIRYDIGDEVVLDTQACSCGSPFPILKTIAGRQAEFLWFERDNGEREFIHPLIIGDFFIPGLERFQIVQPERNRLVVKAVMSGEETLVSKAIRHKIDQFLEEKRLKSTIQLSIEKVEAIPNDARTGKFRFIVPLKT